MWNNKIFSYRNNFALFILFILFTSGFLGNRRLFPASAQVLAMTNFRRQHIEPAAVARWRPSALSNEMTQTERETANELGALLNDVMMPDRDDQTFVLVFRVQGAETETISNIEQMEMTVVIDSSKNRDEKLVWNAKCL